MKLSILDQSVWVEGRGQDDALRDTLSLAQQAEALGYARFWVSEHHGLPTIVGSAPEVLMAAIAARTQRIRVGSAGVMLPHYSAFKVAEQFRVLDALAPGRIDLGVGRAPGSDARTARALNPAAAGSPDGFPDQVQELIAWTRGVPLHRLHAHPEPPAGSGFERAPEVWMLGSSDYGAQLAAQLGLPYAFAYFFTDGQGVELALQVYRTLYRPSDRHPAPHAAVCVWALVADSDEEARHHALSRERWRVDRQQGRLGPLRWPDQIARSGFDGAELPLVEALRAKAFVGTPQRVGEQLRRLAADLRLDELVVNTWTCDPAMRRRSYALLAREFGLSQAAQAPAD